MYKQATRMGLRFETEKGLLTVEQLWGCTRAMLGREIKKVYAILKENETEEDDLDFLTNDVAPESKDPVNELRFDILKDVYLTLDAEAKAARDAEKTKQHNKRIDELIAAKKDEELASKSIEELEALRK